MIESLKLSAIVPSTNITETKKFLIENLQFDDVKMVSATKDYAIARTANTELHMQSTSGTPNEMSLYLLVKSVDDVWENLKDLKDIKVKAPFVQPYGLKECHVILPYTNALIFIGEDLG